MSDLTHLPAQTLHLARSAGPGLPPEIPGLADGLRIQARSVQGAFTRWRWAFVWATQLLFYGLPWVTWEGLPAVWFDLDARRFHLLGAVLFPQDLIYLTGLLVFSALLLFLATTLAGRVWCGFTCPQTVYTEIFQWVEHHTEGDRQARLRLDAAAWGPRKLLRRGGKHLVWALIGLWTGLTLVSYFTPIRSLLPAVAQGALGPWEAFWVLFYGAATYLHAGVLREKVCQHMCPYGRFQAALMDRDTLIVAYDTRRGEPRGSRPRGSDARVLNQGACVDCTLCVQVCPVGIDIRQGLQAACIACGACIDACNRVMDQLKAPRGLIRLSTPRGLEGGAGQQARGWQSRARPRVWLYGGLLSLVGLALVVGWLQRPTLRLNAMRDRSVMARQVGQGEAENLYRLQLMNASGRPHRVVLNVSGAEGLSLLDAEPVLLEPAGAQTVSVRVRMASAPAQSLAGQIVPIRFELRGLPDHGEAVLHADTASTLVLPH